MATSRKHGTLCGKYFIKFYSDERVMKYAGKITQQIGDDYWIVSILNFLIGDFSCERLYSNSSLGGDECNIYTDEEAWAEDIRNNLGRKT